MRTWSILMLALVAAGCTARADNGKAEPKNYDLAARVEPAEPRQGGTAAFLLTITPRSPWVLKAETPLKVKLQASAGLALAKDQLGVKDIVDPKSAAKSVRTGVEAKAAGKQEIAATLEFFLCTDQMCKREQDALELPVTVR